MSTDEDIDDVLSVTRCPKCEGTVDHGYGLMGGGMGTYVVCVEDGCDFFRKEQDADEAEVTP